MQCTRNGSIPSACVNATNKARTDPMTATEIPLSDSVKEKIRECFATPADREQAERVLLEYREGGEQGAERIRLDILELCGSSLDSLLAFLETAKKDFRDVILFAEYDKDERDEPVLKEKFRNKYPHSRDRARREIAKSAAAMLDGSLSIVEGARQVCRLRFAAELDSDPDIMKFVGIDSETDAYPMGEVRKLWNPDALDKLQPKIDEAEQWARRIGTAACENLVRRFGGTT
jgi:hypothetical protein